MVDGVYLFDKLKPHASRCASLIYSTDRGFIEGSFFQSLSIFRAMKTISLIGLLHPYVTCKCSCYHIADFMLPSHESNDSMLELFESPINHVVVTEIGSMLIIYPGGLKCVFLDNGTKFQPPCNETYRAEVCTSCSCI
jgi:hypothetical protein